MKLLFFIYYRDILKKKLHTNRIFYEILDSELLDSSFLDFCCLKPL